MAKRPRYVPVDYLDTDQEASCPLDRFEVEVQLAIAQFVIKRVAGTTAGKEIFDALIPRYDNRFPYHKLLANYLTSPEHMETQESDEQYDDIESPDAASLVPRRIKDI
jgi:hypothetical protein